MSVAWLIGEFLVFWGIIYTFAYILQRLSLINTQNATIRSRRRSFQAGELLPTSSTGQRVLEEEEDDVWNQHSRELMSSCEVKLFHIRYHTNGFNRLFHRLAMAAPQFWEIWFNIGVMFGAITLVVGTVTIVYAAIQIVMSVKSLISTAQPPVHDGRLRKRDDPSLYEQPSEDQVFLPMIPGVTLPVEHLGYYLVALLVSGVLHEAGHAIASFHEHIPINHSGVFLYILYPGAFVDIPSRPLSLLSPRRQLKVICAGVWHNFVLWVIVALVLSNGLKLGLQLTGWRSLEGNGGVGVVDVRADSPLAKHLPISSVIYRLNDVYLENNIADWNKMLIENGVWSRPSNGFCVEGDELDVADSKANLDCCKISKDYPFGKSSDPDLACFQDFLGDVENTNTDPQYLTCLSTSHVLTHPKRTQCSRSIDCSGAKSRCMTPYTPEPKAQIIRIYRRPPSWESTVSYPPDKPVVFVGELVDIWESVKVGLLQPRFSFLPVSLPQILELTLTYMASFTLALSLLNILPAFQLDGEYALGNFISLLIAGDSSEDQGLSTRNALLRQRAKRFEALIVRITSGVVGLVIVGSIFLGILNATV